MNHSAAADNVRSLMARKDAIEAEMEAQLSVLKSNSMTMDTPLVDPEGFPLADVDIWAVRHARVRIIELRNDLKALMDKIMLALQQVYDPSAQSQSITAAASSAEHASTDTPQPFAKVDGVAPGSPAATAVSPCGFTTRYFGSLTVFEHARGSCERILFCPSVLSPNPPSRHHHSSRSRNLSLPKKT